MNPIDKITDPTFTNSSKGLLTLFCIGLAHTIVGVDLTSTEIAIPWLPSINFPNTERLSYLYWGLVFFTVYRYVLHNIRPFKESYFKAICLFLKSSSGMSFIDSTIYAQDLSHQVEVLDNLESPPTVIIKHYEYGEEYGPNRLELMATFEMVFTKDYSFDKLIYTENPVYRVDQIILRQKEAQQKWGLSLFVDDDGEETFISGEINSIWIRLKLGIPTIRKYFSLLMSNKDTFDLSVPVLLNVALLFYCISVVSFLAIFEFIVTALSQI